MSRKRKQDFLLKQKSAQLNEMTEEPATQRLYWEFFPFFISFKGLKMTSREIDTAFSEIF